MWVGVLLALVLVLLTAFLLYGRWRHQHWQRLGVYSPAGWPILGHFLPLLNIGELGWIFRDRIYKETRDSNIYGIYEFFKPNLSLGDVEVVYNICVKDFDHFVNTRSFNLDDEITNEMLISAKGAHWKGIRSVMSPTFSSGKMKSMFHLVQEKSQALVEHCDREKNAVSVVDLGDAFGKYTMDVIASCAFGMATNTLQGENKEFLDAAGSIFKFNLRIVAKFMLAAMCKPLYRLLNLKAHNPSMNYFIKIIKNTLSMRESGPRRGDFVDLMLDARVSQEKVSQEGKFSSYTLTDDCIVAQAVLFIIAGFDTTANTLKFAGHLLAKNQQQQEILRKEIQDLVRQNDNGKLTYQAIMEANYLDAVLSETLRLYPPAHVLERECTKEYNLPGTDIIIPEGQIVSFPVYSIHRDERYYTNPEDFQPERFLPENRKDIPQGAYLPFGIGPRMCIAQRFALMESKLALAELVLRYRLSLADGHTELIIDTTPGILRPLKGTVQIKIEEVKNE